MLVGADDAVVVEVDDEAEDEDFGEGPWKSTHDSVRMALPPELIVSAFGLTV
ncbi:hypothetical protein MSZK_15700 [Mycobacterium sp. shizuoka-1]|nr:hypothetical protein MSZK_15700 [Mycobacterium sp. shizuoka-1]